MWVSSMLEKCIFSADTIDAICQLSLGQKLEGFCIVKYNVLGMVSWKLLYLNLS